MSTSPLRVLEDGFWFQLQLEFAAYLPATTGALSILSYDRAFYATFKYKLPNQTAFGWLFAWILAGADPSHALNRLARDGSRDAKAELRPMKYEAVMKLVRGKLSKSVAPGPATNGGQSRFTPALLEQLLEFVETHGIMGEQLPDESRQRLRRAREILRKDTQPYTNQPHPLGEWAAEWLQRQPTTAQPAEGLLRAAPWLHDNVPALIWVRAPSLAELRILSAIQTRNPLPSYMIYETDKGAANWISASASPSYSFQRDALRYWEFKADKMMTAIKDALPYGPCMVVSLGPGDGEKDAILVERLRQTGIGRPLAYVAYDASYHLLLHALSVIERRHRRHVEVAAVLAKFEDMREIQLDREQPRIISLLGNTLGNEPEEEGLLDCIRRWMTARDLLLLEVRIDAGKGQLQGNSTDRRLHAPTVELVGGTWLEEEMNLKREVHHWGSGVTTRVLYPRKLIDTKFRGNELEQVHMISIHEYDLKTLEEQLKAQGFNVLKTGKGSAQHAAILVRRKEHNE